MSKEESIKAREEVERENDYIVQLICEEIHIPIEDFDPSYHEGESNNQIIKNETAIQWYSKNPPYG